MAEVFAEIFITDATIELSKLSLRYSKKDTIEYYKPIYSNMGYTEEQFNNSIQYYTENPDALDKVLDRAINILSRMETEQLTTMSRDAKEDEKQGLWEDKSNWKLPEDGKRETVGFKIPLHGEGEYTVSAKVTVYKKDESLNPSMVAWFHSDSLNEREVYAENENIDTLINHSEKADTIKTDTSQKQWIDYRKDGVSRTVTLSLTLSDTIFTHLKGEIMSHTPQENDDWEKKAEIKNISVYFIPTRQPWYERGIKPPEVFIKKDTNSKKLEKRIKTRKEIEKIHDSGIKRR